MLEDTRFALRALRSHPGPALVAVTCLSLGIGANIALFGVVDALLLSPPRGVSHAESLVRVQVGAAPGGLAQASGASASYPQYQAIADQHTDVLAGLAAYGREAGTMGGGADARPVDSRIVTGNFFSLLGVGPALGRFFDAAEGAPRSGAAVAVLSYHAWRNRFGRDRAVIGRAIEVNGVPLTVVGVAPEGFVGVDLGDPDLWAPIGLVDLPEFGGEHRLGGGFHWLQLVGRLAPGVSVERALAMTAPAAPADPFVAQPYREHEAGGEGSRIPVSLAPLRTMFFDTPGNRSPVAPWALWISAAVLLLACATVANLLLAEAARGRRDVAVRLALGGSPARIIREQLLKSGVIAALSVVGASALAWISIVLVRRLPIPPIAGVVSLRSVALGIGVALLTPLLFGAVPAVWMARRRVGEVLKERGGAGVPSVSTLQRALMAAQTAIGFVLLLVAALFVHSLRNVKAIDTGMEVNRVLTVRLDQPALVDRTSPDLIAASLEAIRRVPGVESAALGSMIPFYLYSRRPLTIDGRPAGDVLFNTVGPDYFRTLGIDVVEGRPLNRDDGRGSPMVAMVSEGLARAEWPAGDALGSCVKVPSFFGDACVEVVGIERGARYLSRFADASRTVHLAAAQVPDGMKGQTIFVRSHDPATLIPRIRRVVEAIDPSMPFVQIQPLHHWLGEELIPWEVGADLFSVLGALAALLAAVGLYMVVSFIASQRTRELGIRAALGAGRSQLVGLVLRAGLRISGVGLLAGAVLGIGVAALFRTRLYGLTFLDAATYAEVASALVIVTLIASLRPAARVAATDPAVVLKEE
jgi:putative ABC transport system permease protein